MTKPARDRVPAEASADVRFESERWAVPLEIHDTCEERP